jgi:hypothetical protein
MRSIGYLPQSRQKCARGRGYATRRIVPRSPNKMLGRQEDAPASQQCRMWVFDRELIRGGHYGQRSCEPQQQRAGHMAAPTSNAT